MWHKPSYIKIKGDEVQVSTDDRTVYVFEVVKDEQGTYIGSPSMCLETPEQVSRVIEGMAHARTLLIREQGRKDG